MIHYLLSVLPSQFDAIDVSNTVNGLAAFVGSWAGAWSQMRRVSARLHRLENKCRGNHGGEP